MIILKSKQIITIALLILIAITVGLTQEKQTKETVTLPITGKTIILDARTWISRQWSSEQ